MFDPYNAPNLTENPIIRLYELKGKQMIVLLKIQEQHFITKLTPFHNYDELVADRMKFMTTIQPNYIAKIEIPGVPEPSQYMNYIPFKITLAKDVKPPLSLNQILSTKVEIIHDIPLKTCKIKEFVKERNIEIWRIFVFCYLFGIKYNESNLYVRQGKLILKDEILTYRSVGDPKLLEKYFCNYEIVEQARKEIVDSFSIDHLRGILYGFGEPLKSTYGMKQINLGFVDARPYIENVDMRHEAMENMDARSLLASMCSDSDIISSPSPKGFLESAKSLLRSLVLVV